MKTTIRIPTSEQYAYVEVEFDRPMTPEEIAIEYRNHTTAITGGVGLDTKVFNRILDRYLWGDGAMEADEYAGMNVEQISVVQTIKRSKARNKK
jgi:hypothetical protein